MNFLELTSKIRSGAYQVTTPYPQRVKHLALDSIIDENQTVIWNRNEVLRRNIEACKAHDQAVAAYRADANVKGQAERDDTIAAIMNEGFAHDQAEAIYSYAYEHGHSSGASEIVAVAQNTCEFVRELREIWLVNSTSEYNREIDRLRFALKDARATLLGLQPDFGGPIAARMGKAIQRINDALATPSTI